MMFTAQDPPTIREVWARARPYSDHLAFYQAAVAQRQADQIYNLSLTRTATVTLAQGTRSVIGVGQPAFSSTTSLSSRSTSVLNQKFALLG